jgi:AraC family transcriptional regulator of adaptative response/methylated-DNA-[protein]-cysteine methyltransferase
MVSPATIASTPWDWPVASPADPVARHAAGFDRKRRDALDRAWAQDRPRLIWRATMQAIPSVAGLPDQGLEAVRDEARWQACVTRDSRADGRFVLAVRTTGIYCRPSCPARQAKRENCRFFADPAAARAAGYRACRRCRPDETLPEPNAAIARACRIIETAESPPRLEPLARAVGLSPFHFHRRFREVTGLTPRAYAAAHRRARVHAALEAARSVTEAIYDAGYGSASRFYADRPAAAAIAPSRRRQGGAGETIRFATAPCPLGRVLVAATRRGVCAILFGDTVDALAAELRQRFPRASIEPADTGFGTTVAAVAALVDTPARGLDLPLDIQGTAFQERVWQALRAIPPGTTLSYAEIAQAIGRPGAARAVARACAQNRLAVAIPCHRVVGSDGKLAGYRWGVERKRALLERERGTIG